MNKPIIVSLLAFMTMLSGVTYYSLKNQTASLRGAQMASATDVYQAWVQWVNTYGKTYQHDEVPLKYQTFTENYNFINNFNTQKKQFTVGLNQFADLSNVEFVALQKNQLIKKTQVKEPVEINYEIPTSVDWRSKGAVTPVKNQGQCGSCWSFSTTGALEGLNFIKNGNLLSFSEQQLVDCSGSYGNQGCNGGLMDYAFEYAEKYGMELESAYPYKAQDQSCQYKSASEKFKNTGYKDVASNSTQALQSAIANQPVSVAIEADQQSFQFYSGGVYDDASCGTSLDHGVLAVGYDNSGSKPYYIVKNSWGSSWGSNGYINIAVASGPGICGIQMQPSFPTA